MGLYLHNAWAAWVLGIEFTQEALAMDGIVMPGYT